MARRKAATNGHAEPAHDTKLESEPAERSRRASSSHSSPDADRPPGPLSVSVPPDSRDVIRVNNANLTELKNACDDAVKRHLSRPELFNQIHAHTDVRLALGWAGVFTAAATGLYGWKVEFEQSKPVVWAGLILYVVLTVLQTLYAYFVEGDIVFVGKRKTFSKRIVTERITLSSHTHHEKPAPAYEVTITYVRSASSGKTLLARGRTRARKGYNAFFDSAGVMDQEAFETWLGTLVEDAMEGKST
ncbi:hypothetical protein PLICRDRAFT_141656 [Plicaturopsis crispa FD-325 SS-3]|nr:hypothetical protein PLICRDRAFT_141656 [Plicaturopsis crispa FD-325 SS-3]